MLKSYPWRLLIMLASVLVISLMSHASAAAIPECSVSELNSTTLDEDIVVRVHGYVVGYYDMTAKTVVLGLPTVADTKVGRNLILADSREATLSNPLCYVKLASDGTIDDINLSLHPEVYLGELSFVGTWYMSSGMPRVDYRKGVTDYTIELYDPSQGGSDLPQPQELYIEGNVNGDGGFRGALVRSGAGEYTGVFPDGLNGRWAISGGQWQFGAGNDEKPLEDGSTVHTWFGGGEFVSNITAAVRVTFTYTEGSARSGSTIPSSLVVESIGTGEGTVASPYTVAQVLGMVGEWADGYGPQGVYVRGYIVGHISKEGEAVFGPYDENSGLRELLVADEPEEDDPTKVIGMQLKVNGSQQQDIGLSTNPDHIGHGIIAKGDMYSSIRGSSFAGIENISDYRIIPTSLHASWGDPSFYSCPLEQSPRGFVSSGFDVATWRNVRLAMTGTAEGTEDDGYGHLMLSLSGGSEWHSGSLSYGRVEATDTVRLDRTATATVALKVYPASTPCTESGHIVLPSGEYAMFADTDSFTPTLTLTRNGATVGGLTVIADPDTNGNIRSQWYTPAGIPLPCCPTSPGLYIERRGPVTRKIIIH